MTNQSREESDAAKIPDRITSVFSPERPSDADERPEAICPWCGVRIKEVDLRFDRTPVPATVLLTWRCKNCQRLHGHQIVPLFWVVANAGIEGMSGQDMRDVLANLRNPADRKA
jgi:hypothetical protein